MTVTLLTLLGKLAFLTFLVVTRTPRAPSARMSTVYRFFTIIINYQDLLRIYILSCKIYLGVGKTGVLVAVQVHQVALLSRELNAGALNEEAVVVLNQSPDQIGAHDLVSMVSVSTDARCRPMRASRLTIVL